MMILVPLMLFALGLPGAAPDVGALSTVYARFLEARLARDELDRALALERLDEALSAAGSEPWLHVERATLLRELGRVSEALDECHTAAGLDPGLADPWLVAAGIYLDSREPGMAAKALARGASSDPSDPRPWLRLGRLAEAEGDLEAASRCYRRALALEPDGPGILFRLGETALAQGALTRAEELYRRCLEVDPGFVSAYHQLVDLLASMDRLPEAWAVAQRSFAVAPSDDTARVLAKLGLALGRVDEARSYLDTIRDVDPGDRDTAMETVSLMIRARDWGPAARLLRDMLRFDPGNSRLRAYLADALFQLGDRAGAGREARALPPGDPLGGFLALVFTHPPGPGLYLVTARAFEARGDPMTAARALELCRARGGAGAEVERELGRAYLELGELPLALVTLRRALAQSPDDPETCYLLARALVRVGARLNEAEGLLRAALAEAPGNPRYMAELGLVRVEQGEVAEGRALAERAAGLAGDDPLVRQALDMVREALARRAGAMDGLAGDVCPEPAGSLPGAGHRPSGGR